VIDGVERKISSREKKKRPRKEEDCVYSEGGSKFKEPKNLKRVNS
jgi:hypothetical protein